MNTTNGKWIPDLENLTCRHNGSTIEVVFQKQGKTFIGKLNDMPDALMDTWAADPDGNNRLMQTVMDAEEAFMRAYAERVL